MATKWKKWKGNLACAAFVIGVSLLITGGIGYLREMRFQSGISSVGQILKEPDYQNSRIFRDFIASRLDCFLDMACGDPVYDDYYGYYGYYGNTVYAEEDVVQEAEQTYAGMEALDEATYGSADAGWPEEEIKEWIESYHDAIKADQNVLYVISYGGMEMYTNREQRKWDGTVLNLPDGYNFYLHFDGEKAVVKKDGQYLDIYGDGIYREGDDDWYIPGYRNFTAKEKWKGADIVMIAVKDPVPYMESFPDRNYGYGGLYGVYQNYIGERSLLFRIIACTSAGAALFVLYLFLRKDKREWNRKAAAVTAKMWFEWKVLLGLVLPALLLLDIVWRKGLAYAYDAAYFYKDVPYYEYVWELSDSLLNGFSDCMGQFLAAFWLFYAFAADLRRNKGSYKNGIFGKCAAALKRRDLKLSVSKRMVKRTYGIFILTVVLLVYLFCVFLACIFWAYQMGNGEMFAWCIEGAFALTALLLAAEYIYLKKNKKTAFDLGLLSEQLEGIRDGNYQSGEEPAIEDADLRHMARELEDIQQGLETAVEERIRSERMKVELVANVSHDIKTPLTSIISYIQLLKQEEGLPDYVADYVRILDEKSERLKNMVQDVFAVSKAASGQLLVELKELDLGKLLYQTLADMEEPIQNSPVTVKTQIPKGPVMVCTDGQRMYRVFQNLIGNAVKYSLEGSRVYVTLKEEGSLAVASVKNTSSEELNREIDFAERFTRGDESRTDGGSGLGLSIAKSFTEACGGTFRLEVIADLFVVTVSLPRVNCGEE